jgi:hypothetical protein
MAVIEILRRCYAAKSDSIEPDHKEWRLSLMKSDYPFSPTNGEKKPEVVAPSRFIDEKISDEWDTESQADSALKPAGLNNPFWN